MSVFSTLGNNQGWLAAPYATKAIVIDNQDTEYPDSGRVQVYIPDVHGVNIDKFFGQKESITFRFPGNNIIGDLTEEMVNYLRGICPWAVPCAPIIGETGPGIYRNGTASTSDVPCDSMNDNFAPANFAKPGSPYDASYADLASNPQFAILGRGNTFGNEYRSPSYSNQPKGVYGIPRVGATLLVTFLKGDTNFPVYLGNMPAVAEFQSILSVGGNQNSPKGFESPVNTKNSPIPLRPPPDAPPKPQPNVNTNAQPISRSPDVKPPPSSVQTTMKKIGEAISNLRRR